MANTSKLLEALSSYTGDQTTLEAFTKVAKQELGDDWSGQIYDTLPNLPSHLKEKLDHAYNYYGASLSWTEIQSYLLSQDPLNVSEVSARIETLSYWLNFFGEAGTNAVEQLKQKLADETERQAKEQEVIPPVEEETVLDAAQSAYEENSQTPVQEEQVYDETGYEEAYQEDQEYSAEGYEEPYQEPQAYDETGNEEAYQEDQEYSAEGYEEAYQEPQAYEQAGYEEAYQEEPAYDDEGYEVPYTETQGEEPYQNDEQDLYMDGSTYENAGYQDSYGDNGIYEGDGYQDSYGDNLVYEGDGYQDSYNGQEYYEGDSYQDSYNEQEYVDEDGSFWQEPVYTKQENETIEEFMAKKAFHQVDFLNAVQCWVNARCIALGNKEIYAYRHYGFLVDLMEQTKKDVQEVLSAPKYYPAIEAVRQDGLKKLQRYIASLESDLKTAYDNLPSELTDLISDSTSANDLRKMLGAIDTSNKPELLGEAPDGFEMLEDPFEGTSIAKEMKRKSTPQTPAGTTAQPPKKTGLSFNKKNAL